MVNQHDLQFDIEEIFRGEAFTFSRITKKHFMIVLKTIS